MSVYSAFTRFISDSTSSSTASHEPYSAVKPLSEMMPMFAPIGVDGHPSISANGPVATAGSVSPRPDCTSCVGRSLTWPRRRRRSPRACLPRSRISSSQCQCSSRGVSEWRYTTCAASPSRRRCAADAPASRSRTSDASRTYISSSSMSAPRTTPSSRSCTRAQPSAWCDRYAGSCRRGARISAAPLAPFTRTSASSAQKSECSSSRASNALPYASKCSSISGAGPASECRPRARSASWCAE